MSEPWVSIEDVAAHLGVTKLSVYRWIEKRGLPATKIGKLWKLRLSEVDAWMREQRSTTTRPERVVLVVDDEALVRASIAEYLEESGYRVLQAGDGAEALGLLGQKPRPDLILLDLKMPNVDGWRFREEQIKNPELAALPVIVVTAASAAELDGVTAVLRKPIRLPLLAKTIASLLEEDAR